MNWNWKKIGAKRIVFDGVCISDYFDVTAYITSPFPDVDVKTVKIPGRAGSKFLSAEIGERQVRLKLSLKGFERTPMRVHQLWRDFNPLLIKGEPKPMFFDDDKFLNVIPTSGTELERLDSRGVSEVTFRACDPYFYSREEDETELEPGVNKVFIYGTFPVLSVFEVTGVTGQLQLTDKETGYTVLIPNVGKADDVVMIDMDRQRCSVGGVYLPVDPDITDFFDPLPPGNREIELSAGTGVLRYRERYL